MLLSSDYIFSPERWLDHHLLEIDDGGTILNVRERNSTDKTQHYRGLLCPGWVNAHCHLEFSALKGHVSPGTGMTGFIAEIFDKREAFTDREKRLAAEKAMKELLATGTVAVGDICNTGITIRPKKEISALYSHSFIELVGLNGLRANDIFEEGLDLASSFGQLPHSLTPHAPYSVSVQLLRELYSLPPQLRSIHLLESEAERVFFEQNSGDFPKLYHTFKLPYQPFGVSSPWEYITSGLPADADVIWVHCTEMRPGEIEQLAANFPNSMFCLCPRSNQYIHRRLPNVHHFLPFTDRICLGTDSLASNYSLDMFDEVKALQRAFGDTPLHTFIKWATLQGAKALQRSDKFGIFKPGFRPGINLISEVEMKAIRLTKNSRVEKLF